MKILRLSIIILLFFTTCCSLNGCAVQGFTFEGDGARNTLINNGYRGKSYSVEFKAKENWTFYDDLDSDATRAQRRNLFEEAMLIPGMQKTTSNPDYELVINHVKTDIESSWFNVTVPFLAAVHIANFFVPGSPIPINYGVYYTDFYEINLIDTKSSTIAFSTRLRTNVSLIIGVGLFGSVVNHYKEYPNTLIATTAMGEQIGKQVTSRLGRSTTF